MARVAAVCIGAGGIPKHPVEAAWLARDGFSGDGHDHPGRHGGPDQAVCLFAIETYAWLRDRGLPLLAPGAVGENLALEGLPLHELRAPDLVRIGDVLLELTRPRTPCRRLDSVDDRLRGLLSTGLQRGALLRVVSTRWSGWYARVVRCGTVRSGAPVEVFRERPVE